MHRMRRRTATAGLLIAAVLVAGCTALDTSPSGDGVTTTSEGISLSLRSVESVVDPQDSVRVELSMENTGEQEASVTGLSWGGAPFMTASGCSQDRSVGDIPTLAPVDTGTGTAGDTISVLRTCPYPDGVGVDPGETDTFPATASVTYDYTTVSTASVTIVPDDAAGGSASQSTTAGPLRVSMTLPAETTPPQDGTLRVPVMVENVGPGEVSGDITLDATPDALDCPSTVTLVGGSRSIECTLSTGDSGVERSERLRLQFDYAYEAEAATSVRISG